MEGLGYYYTPTISNRINSSCASLSMYIKSLNAKTIGFIFLGLLGLVIVGAIVYINYPQNFDNKSYEDRINDGDLPHRTSKELYGCIGYPVSLVGPAECANIRANEWKDLIAKLNITNNLEGEFLWHLLWPVADCVRKDRIGRVGEGGRWVCNAHKVHKPCAVYSFGMEETGITFELFWAYLNFECSVFIFDPGYQNILINPVPGVSFHKKGLGPTGGTLGHPQWDLSLGKDLFYTHSLLNITKQLGLGSSPKLDILRIDIEGAENYAIPYMLNEAGFDDLNIGQILIEFHYAIGKEDMDSILDIVLKLLEKEFYIFNIEANSYMGISGVEVAFVHRSLLED